MTFRTFCLAAAVLAAGAGPAWAQQPVFADLDRDGNGVLTVDETPVPLFPFRDRFDADGDTAFDEAEYDAAWAHLVARLQRGAALTGEDLVLDTPDAIQGALDRFVAHHELDGAALIVGTAEGKALELYAGDYAPDTTINIASSSKWLTGAIVGTVVEETALSYTDTVASWRPELADRPVGEATLEQLMSFTAGAVGLARGGGRDLFLPGDMSFEVAADTLLENDLEATPGTQFAYGSWTMQVGGIWAASVAGESWEALHNRILAEPLGFEDSGWSDFVQRPGDVSFTNPNLQGGLWASPRDLARFAHAVHNNGMVDGEQALNAAALAGLERDLIGDRGTPERDADEAAYHFGIGIWCEEVNADGTCPVVTSPGAWGTRHWVDREQGLWGVFVVFDRGPRIQADQTILRDAAEAYVLSQSASD